MRFSGVLWKKKRLKIRTILILSSLVFEFCWINNFKIYAFFHIISFFSFQVATILLSQLVVCYQTQNNFIICLLKFLLSLKNWWIEEKHQIAGVKMLKILLKSFCFRFFPLFKHLKEKDFFEPFRGKSNFGYWLNIPSKKYHGICLMSNRFRLCFGNLSYNFLLCAFMIKSPGWISCLIWTRDDKKYFQWNQK